MKVARSRGEIVPRDFAAAVKDIKLAILQSRARAAHASNVEALKLYFYVGGYVSKKTRTAKWGSGAIDALSNRLQVELPGLRGFSASNIKYMRIFFEAWTKWFEIRHLASDEFSVCPIRQTASDEIDADMAQAFLSIGFSHHTKILLSVKDYDERWFYIRACSANHWSYTELMSLVANIEKTIQALGGDDFCFMGREKRLVYSGEEFFIDLLFYHRGLRAMVAVELKMGKFRPSYLGQLEFYLSALDELMKKPEENPSIGLLLCEKMNKGVVEFAVRDKSKPLGIATYKTLKAIPKPYRSLAPVIEGVRREFANGLRERSKKKGRS